MAADVRQLVRQDQLRAPVGASAEQRLSGTSSAGLSQPDRPIGTATRLDSSSRTGPQSSRRDRQLGLHAGSHRSETGRATDGRPGAGPATSRLPAAREQINTPSVQAATIHGMSADGSSAFRDRRGRPSRPRSARGRCSTRGCPRPPAEAGSPATAMSGTTAAACTGSMSGATALARSGSAELPRRHRRATISISRRAKQPAA
mgnify:CR=1 FL=1